MFFTSVALSYFTFQNIFIFYWLPASRFWLESFCFELRNSHSHSNGIALRHNCLLSVPQIVSKLVLDLRTNRQSLVSQTKPGMCSFNKTDGKSIPSVNIWLHFVMLSFYTNLQRLSWKHLFMNVQKNKII